MAETAPQRPSSNVQQEYLNSFGFLDKVRMGAKLARVILRTSVMHPSFIFISPAMVFDVADPEKVAAREKRNEKLVLKLHQEMTDFAYSQELGSDAYRFEIAHLLGKDAVHIAEHTIETNRSYAAAILEQLPILQE